MMKAMASDFDNTLYFMFLDEPYRKGTEAIRAFQQAGVYLASALPVSGAFGRRPGKMCVLISIFWRRCAGSGRQFAGAHEENRFPGLRRRNI